MKSLFLKVFLFILLQNIIYAASVSLTIKYGKTGGIVGKLNRTSDKINGRDICPANPTNG